MPHMLETGTYTKLPMTFALSSPTSIVAATAEVHLFEIEENSANMVAKECCEVSGILTSTRCSLHIHDYCK
jgi:hypothetical protein